MSDKKKADSNRSVLRGILILAELVGIGAGLYLTNLHFHAGGAVCDIEDTIFQCSTVAVGPFSTIFGIPIAYLGILTYITCLVLTVMGGSREKSRFHAHIPNYMLGIATWCLLYSIFLAFVSQFIVKAFCLFCILLYLVNLTLFICAVIWSGDVEDGRWKPLVADILKGIGMPHVWGAVLGVCILLVVSAYAFTKIEMDQPRPGISGPTEWNLADNPGKGAPDARVVVIEVSDLKCPWCSRAYDTVRQAAKTYGDKFYLYYVHYPLDKECNPDLSRTIHPQACIGSYAAYCAQKQGKFWEYSALLFNRQKEDWDLDMLTAYAEELVMDTSKFKQCMADPKTEEVIKQDIEDAKKNGVHATPAFFFNGRDFGNAASSQRMFLDALEKALTEPEESAKATAETTVVPTQ